MQKYKNQKNNPNRDIKMLVFLAIAVAVLAILSNVISNLDFSNEKDTDEINIANFQNIQEVLEYYNCTYIKEENSKEDGYETDVYARLSKKLYEDDETSNENFYNRLIKLSASVLNFKSFRIIDTENDITIAVQCDGQSIKKIFINGIEDYFTYMNSQKSLKEYKEIKTTDFGIDSEELNNLIQGSWSVNSLNLGKTDGIFQEYEQYLAKGIKIRKINGKIYNIVFTKGYTNSVISGIMVREGFEVAKSKFGTPSFEDTENNVYGYKGNDCYVFFSADEISVYRRTKENDYSDFVDLTNKLSNSELDLYQFMNELTYLWPDYSKYVVNQDSFYITYPLKGIAVKCNYDNTSAIIIYNNCGMTTSQISQCLNMPEVLAQMQVDNVFEAEKDRVSNTKNLLTNCEKFVEENKTENNPLINSEYSFYAEKDENGNINKIYFVSKDGTKVNREMIEYIDTYAWLSDTLFLYSIPQKGIYCFNLENNQKMNIISGKEEFKIQSCNNDLLKYDDKEIQINF